MDTTPVRFTQYLLPDGRTRQVTIDLEDGKYGFDPEKYKALVNLGLRFEAEILTTGVVSFTIEDTEDMISIQLSQNGPEVPGKIAALIEDAYSKCVGRFHKEET